MTKTATGSYAFRLGVTVGVDVVELDRSGTRNTEGERWHTTLDSLSNQLSRLAQVKEVEGPLVNGIVAVTFEGQRDPAYYLAKVEKVARRVFQISADAERSEQRPAANNLGPGPAQELLTILARSSDECTQDPCQHCHILGRDLAKLYSPLLKAAGPGHVACPAHGIQVEGHTCWWGSVMLYPRPAASTTREEQG